LNCIEPDELQGGEIPYYKVQTELDNGISYFSDAPDESIGKIIPVLYGIFSEFIIELLRYQGVPVISTLKRGHEYIIASHICRNYPIADLYSSIFEYIEDSDSVCRLASIIYSANESVINTRAGLKIKLGNENETIYGHYYLYPKIFSGDGINNPNSVDGNIITFAELAPNKVVSWQIDDSSLSEVGSLSTGFHHCFLKVFWDANGGNVNLEIKMYHPQKDKYYALDANIGQSGSGINYELYFEFGIGNQNWINYPAKYEDTPQWTLNELQEMEFQIINKSTSVGTAYIKNIILGFVFMNVYSIRPKYLMMQVSGQGWYESAPRTTLWQMNQKATINKIQSNILAAVQGYIFDNWIG